MMYGLRPCPICDGEFHLHNLELSPVFYFRCAGCGLSTSIFRNDETSLADAIRELNRRAGQVPARVVSRRWDGLSFHLGIEVLSKPGSGVSFRSGDEVMILPGGERAG